MRKHLHTYNMDRRELIQRVALILKYHDVVQLPLPCPLGLEYER